MDPLVPFPLLDLPPLPLQRVLTLMKPIEIIIFAHCSTRSFQLSKLRQTPMNLTVDNFEGSKRNIGRIEMREPGNHRLDSQTILVNDASLGIGQRFQLGEFECQYDESFGRKNYLIVHNSAINYTLFYFYEFVNEVFRGCATTIAFIQRSPYYRPLCELLWKNKVEHFHFYDEGMSDEDIVFLINGCKETSTMSWNSTRTIDTNIIPQLNSEVLEVQHAKWATIDFVKGLRNQVKSLYLGQERIHSLIHNNEMREFVMSWYNSEETFKMQNLEVYFFSSSGFDLDTILSGLNGVARDSEGRSHFPNGGIAKELSGGMDIQRKDGAVLSAILRVYDCFGITIRLFPAPQ